MDNYLFQAAPKPVQTRTKKAMYRGQEEESKEATMRNNIMFDRRVARGSTYAPSKRTQPLLPNQSFRPVQAPQATHHAYGALPRREATAAGDKQQHPLTPGVGAGGAAGGNGFGATSGSDSVDFIRIATPEPVAGRVHSTVQTDTYLEDLRRPRGGLGHSFGTQTDAENDRATAPLFVPRSSGEDVATEVEPAALFDFELEVQTVLGVLVDKSLEQAMMEVCEEEEEAALRAHQADHQQRRNNQLAKVQQLVQRDERRQAERERRAKQEAERVASEAAHAQRRQAALMAKQLVERMQEDILVKLDAAGAFYDPVRREVETVFMPALMRATAERIDEYRLAGEVLDQIVRDSIEQYREQAQAAGIAQDEELVARLVAHGLNPEEQPRPVEGVLSRTNKVCAEDEQIAWRTAHMSAAEAAAASASSSSSSSSSVAASAAAASGRQGVAALSAQQRADAIVAGILADRAAAAAAESKRAADIIRIQALQRGKRDRARVEKLAAQRRLEAERTAMSPQELLVSLSNHLGFEVRMLPPGEGGGGLDRQEEEEVWVVSRLDAAGPASQAGLVLGDQIVSYAGVALSSATVGPLRQASLLKSPPFALNPGDALELELVRRASDRRREEVLLEIACDEEGFRDQHAIRDLRRRAELPPAVHAPWLDAEGALDTLQRLPGKLGATMAEVQAAQPQRVGVKLAKVASDSAAARAGLAEGDVIVSLNGAPVADGKAFAQALKERIAGDVLELELLSTAALAKLAANEGASARSLAIASMPTVKKKVELAGGGKKPLSIESLRSLRRIAGLPVFGEQ